MNKDREEWGEKPDSNFVGQFGSSIISWFIFGTAFVFMDVAIFLMFFCKGWRATRLVNHEDTQYCMLKRDKTGHLQNSEES